MDIDTGTLERRMTGLQIKATLARHLWTLQRFGLSPTKSPYRVANPGAPRVLCVSIPKSGTHLLERALCLHPKLHRKVVPTVSDENIGRYKGFDELLRRMRPGQVVVSHLRFKPTYLETLARQAAHPIFLIRDPHAIVVSQVHYVSRTRNHRHHDFFRAQASTKDRLRIAIVGDHEHHVASIGERLEAFAGWLDAGCLVVRFEDLIGPDGGGDRTAQRRAVSSIYDSLNVAMTDDLFDHICRGLFTSASPTFYRGSIDRWREVFDDDLERLLHEVAGDSMARYGYGRSVGAS
jgi:Sulfotransferase domain